MKIRSGFVSNSSSSSFLIEDWNSKLTAEKVKKDVVNMIKKWRDEKLTKKDDYMTEENVKSWHNRVREWWSDKNIEDSIKVERKEMYERFSKDTMENINYWYSPLDINKSHIVIYDECDNFIPEEVCSKIIKKYKRQDKLVNYCLHMG